MLPTNSINAQNISVAGRVVDDNNNPVANALASIPYRPCKTCTDQIIPVFRTNEEGVFFLDDITGAKTARLLIEEPVPDKLRNLLAPVDLTLERFPEFRGTIIKRPKSGATVQMQEISAHIKYKAVSIDLPRLFKADENISENKSSFKISVFYKGIRVADKYDIEERNIDRKENKIKFALPQGTWVLTIESFKNGSRRKTGRVTVKLGPGIQADYSYQRAI